MSEMRGWLVGLQEGTCEIDEVDEIIARKITKARDHAYRLGVIDGRIMRSEVTREPSRRDLTPLGTNILTKDENGLWRGIW